MAIHSSILAWKIPWTEESRGLQSMGSKRVRTTEHTHTNYTKYRLYTVQPNFLQMLSNSILAAKLQSLREPIKV